MVSFSITLKRCPIAKKRCIISIPKRIPLCILAMIFLLYVLHLKCYFYSCFKIVSVEFVSTFPHRMRIFGFAFNIWKKPIYCHYLIDQKVMTTTADKESFAWMHRYFKRFRVDCPIPRHLSITPAVQISLSQSRQNPGLERFALSWIGTWQGATHGALSSAGRSVPLLRVTEAYFYGQTPSMVRFVGLGRVVRKENIFCHFHHKGKTVRTQAAFQSVLNRPEVEFDGCIISCPVPPSIKHLRPSTRVSLSQAEHDPGSVRFPLTRIPDRPPVAPTIALCLAPLFGRIPLLRMIAWIEMNRLLGVNHFMVYDFDMNRDLNEMMTYYRSKGIVSLLKWNTGSIPVSKDAVWPPPRKRVHYYGQFAVYNDCLYRLGNRYRFLMFTDIDEVIVPLQKPLLNDFLEDLDKDYIQQFRFRNTYVRADYPEDAKARQIDPDIGGHNVPFLDFTRREKRILARDLGQKTIVKFKDTLVMGVHELIRTLDLKHIHTHDIPVEDALLFHYRTPPQYLNIPIEGKTSKRLTELVPVLLNRVREVLKMLET